MSNGYVNIDVVRLYRLQGSLDLDISRSFYYNMKKTVSSEEDNAVLQSLLSRRISVVTAHHHLSAKKQSLTPKALLRSQMSCLEWVMDSLTW